MRNSNRFGTTPDPFTFTDLTNQVINTVVQSNIVTVSGIDTPAPVVITDDGETDCAISVGGGGYTATPGDASNGQTVQLQMTTSGVGNITLSCAVTIGGVADGGSPWSTTTAP